MKETTMKEFKNLMLQVYGECDFDSIINKLSILEGLQANDCRSKGCNFSAEHREKDSYTLYKFLADKGYYDE